MSDEGFDEELTCCPECDEYLTGDETRYYGDGEATRDIWCDNCGWSGVENWSHDVTVVQE